ncbi:MAG TPA: hypothetical protein VLV54_21495 [Thermoanaerobaculia bacterium]|nr:hypothetical protein [Thermoanaerobaculia bacterium]
MLDIPVHLFRITVAFNALNSTIILFSDDFIVDTDLTHRRLPIPQGISLIVLDLNTLPGFTGDPAEWNTPALTWYNDAGSELASAPEVFLVQPFLPNHITIVDFNTAKSQNSHRFDVNLLYAGEPFSSDPIIINEPPMQPGVG